MADNDDRIAELARNVTALSEALQAVLKGGISSERQMQHPKTHLGGRGEAWKILREAGLAPPAE